ncbi:uncharacterized protein LOC111370634 [Olea europaea var. sylvestris]|uniref:uncharacterized protein LOC111370634 n=1 Tax=Olea europaea var. sylvestris TaxID=158386 RepID=UPI000C1D6B78|nr:uncharacterized protein LOC111370634 [Olea europaea var. sylvestris]
MRSSTSTWISSMKLFLVLFVIVSFAMAIKFSTPFIVDFVFNQLPVIWSIILSWTKPPYLYIIINGIIITIAATSRFHQTTSLPSVPPQRLVSVKTPPPLDFPSFPVQPEIRAVDVPPLLEYESEKRIVEVKAVLVNGTKVDIDQTEEEIEADTELAGEDKFVTWSSTWTPPHRIISPDVQSELLLPVREKHLAPSTFRHRKTNRANSKGAKVPKVTRQKRQETLEDTWKIIMEARQVPPTKSDTWQRSGHQLTTSRPDHVPKSKTSKNRVNYESPFEAPLRLSSSTKISKESSLSKDELNQRVEAFIKQFNEEMRLQRQESLNQSMEMINHEV